MLSMSFSIATEEKIYSDRPASLIRIFIKLPFKLSAIVKYLITTVSQIAYEILHTNCSTYTNLIKCLFLAFIDILINHFYTGYPNISNKLHIIRLEIPTISGRSTRQRSGRRPILLLEAQSSFDGVRAFYQLRGGLCNRNHLISSH